MENKLSELSKPVAWVLGTPACKHLTTDEEYANWYVEKMSTASPLYSQEYVSALDEVAQYWIGQSAEWKQRAEAAEQRIAELETLLERNKKRAEVLGEMLATPVRLSGTTHPRCRQQHASDIRAAGFTVGDE